MRRRLALLVLFAALVSAGLIFGPPLLRSMSAGQARTATVNATYEHLQAAIGALSLDRGVIASLEDQPNSERELAQIQERAFTAASTASIELDLAEKALRPLAGEREAERMEEAIAHGRSAAELLGDAADGLVEAGRLVRTGASVTSRLEALETQLNRAVEAANRRDWGAASADARAAVTDAEWCEQQLTRMQQINGRLNREAMVDPGIADALRVVSIQRRLSELALGMAQDGQAGDLASFNQDVAEYNQLSASLAGLPRALFENNPQVLLGDRINHLVGSQAALERARRAGDAAVEMLRSSL